MIIDSHIHFMPKKVYEKFADPYAPPQRSFAKGNDFVYNKRLWMIDDHLKAMDYAGVDMSVLTLSQWNLAGSEMTRQINDAVAETLVQHGDRFRAAGAVPVGETEKAVEEIDYMIKELKLSGIALLTSQGQNCTPSTKELMWPIYQKAVEYDVPIFWHPHLLPYGTETDCTINRSIGRGFDVGRAILRIMYDVLPEFPTIKMVMPHFGGVFLAMKGRSTWFFEPPAEIADKVPEDIRPISKTPLEAEEYGYRQAFDERFDKLYIDGAGSAGWEPITKMAFMTVKHDKLVFGTDYPFEIHQGRDYKYYIDSVKNLDIPEESKAAFLGGNMARLLKLDKK